MKDKDIALIERHLLHELDGEERREFEEKRATDAEFRREVEAYEKTVRLIRLSGRRELKARLAARGRQQDAEKASGGLLPRHWIALTVILSLVLAWWFFSKRTSPAPATKTGSEQARDSFEMMAPVPSDTAQKALPQSPVKENRAVEPPAAGRSSKGDKLFAAYFQPYKDDSLEPSVRGEGRLTPEEQFRRSYWEGNYRPALESFEAMGQNSKNNDNLRFLQANCLLAAGRGEAAAAVLEDILRNGGSRFPGQASWYLALSYLQSGRRQEAETLFQQIAADSNSARQADAARLLQAWR